MNSDTLKQRDFFGITSGLTGTAIKLIAAAMMVFDHVYQMFVSYGAPGWFKWIGRPVAILFLFFCAEGYYYTRSKKKYALRLLIGFELMHIVSILIERAMPTDIVLMNSIFGSFFLTVVWLAAADYIRYGFSGRDGRKIAIGAFLFLAPILASVLVLALMMINVPDAVRTWYYGAVMTIPNFMTVEGGFVFPLLGLLLYLLRKNRLLQLLPLVLYCVYCFFQSDIEWMAVFAVIPILFYNGERGKGNKNFFYIFYPAHIYILYVISWAISLRR